MLSPTEMTISAGHGKINNINPINKLSHRSRPRSIYEQISRKMTWSKSASGKVVAMDLGLYVQTFPEKLPNFKN
jgi:hypothetical protein